MEALVVDFLICQRTLCLQGRRHPRCSSAVVWGAVQRSGLGASSNLYFSNDRHATLMELIIDNVDRDSWEVNGGVSTILAVNDLLLIRQAAGNHALIENFLKDLQASMVGGQTLVIHIWWLPLDSGTRVELDRMLARSAADADLNKLKESVGGYRGSIKGRNRVAGNVSSGHNTVLVVSSIPVVGTGAVGEQSVVQQIHLGISAEVTPRLLAEWQGEGVQLSVRTSLTSMGDLITAEDSGGDLDRFRRGNHSLECNSICKLGEATAVGGLSAIGLPSDGEGVRDMTVVVRGIELCAANIPCIDCMRFYGHALDSICRPAKLSKKH